MLNFASKNSPRISRISKSGEWPALFNGEINGKRFSATLPQTGDATVTTDTVNGVYLTTEELEAVSNGLHNFR